jgi:hypothetical protein
MYTNKDKNTNGSLDINGRTIQWPIHPVVMEVIGLTANETKVLNALLTFQMGRDVAKVSKVAGLPRTTTLYTLKKLQKRGLVFKTLHKKRFWWRFERGLDTMIVRRGSGVEGGESKLNNLIGPEDDF